MSGEIWLFSHLFVPFAPRKVLAFDNKSEKKLFPFVLCSLIRTFAPRNIVVRTHTC